MNRPPFHLIAALCLGLASFPGCVAMNPSLTPLSSRPPSAKLTLATVFTATPWESALSVPYKISLPPGDYLPRYENPQYIYYQAPAKVVYKGSLDPGSFLFDGGVYTSRTSATPAGWFYIDADGITQTGAFQTPPVVRTSR